MTKALNRFGYVGFVLIRKENLMKHFIFIWISTMVFSCSASRHAAKPRLLNEQTVLLTEISTDNTYGYSEKNPIEVGGASKNEGPLNQRRFFNALAGPHGEKVSYFRAGSCCPVKSQHGFDGMALLDMYKVTWEDTFDTLTLYLNMYDYKELKAPFGLTILKVKGKGKVK
jgi:hypothetical protein